VQPLFLMNQTANQTTMDCIFDYKLIQYIVCADNKYKDLTNYNQKGFGDETMINNRLYQTTDIINKALQGTWARNETISANIANVDTPGYKRQDVVFETYLREAMKGTGKISQEDLSRITPKKIQDMSSASYRLDGNTVDIDTEMGYLAENQLRYNALISQVNYNFSRIKSVLNA